MFKPLLLSIVIGIASATSVDTLEKWIKAERPEFAPFRDLTKSQSEADEYLRNTLNNLLNLNLQNEDATDALIKAFATPFPESLGFEPLTQEKFNEQVDEALAKFVAAEKFENYYPLIELITNGYEQIILSQESDIVEDKYTQVSKVYETVYNRISELNDEKKIPFEKVQALNKILNNFQTDIYSKINNIRSITNTWLNLRRNAHVYLRNEAYVMAMSADVNKADLTEENYTEAARRIAAFIVADGKVLAKAGKDEKTTATEVKRLIEADLHNGKVGKQYTDQSTFAKFVKAVNQLIEESYKVNRLNI